MHQVTESQLYPWLYQILNENEEFFRNPTKNQLKRIDKKDKNRIALINLFTSLIYNVVKPAFTIIQRILIRIKSLTVDFINVKLFANVSNLT